MPVLCRILNIFNYFFVFWVVERCIFCPIDGGVYLEIQFLFIIFIILLPLNELKNGLEFIKKQLFYISFFIFFKKLNLKTVWNFFYYSIIHIRYCVIGGYQLIFLIFQSSFLLILHNNIHNKFIVGNRSVSVYNSTGYNGGLITNVYITGFMGNDIWATISVNSSLTNSSTANESISIVEDTVSPL